MSEPSHAREARNFRSVLAVVILVHVAVFAIAVVWVRFHPSLPVSSANAAAHDSVIEWIEPEMLFEIPPAGSPEPDGPSAESVIPEVPAPKSIQYRKPPPKIAASSVARRKTSSAPVLRGKPSAVNVSSFQPEVHGGVALDAAPRVQSSSVARDVVADYHSRIQRIMEEKWKQPQHLDGASLPEARVALSIVRSGEIMDAELAASSGDADLDATALAAARSVRQIDPLPSEIENDTYRLIIRFVLH